MGTINLANIIKDATDNSVLTEDTSPNKEALYQIKISGEKKIKGMKLHYSFLNCGITIRRNQPEKEKKAAQQVAELLQQMTNEELVKFFTTGVEWTVDTIEDGSEEEGNTDINIDDLI